ncbi:N-acetylmuramoyl-L-alanine amidase [Fulvivirgaceae bacterium BMA10]|uniref:N-acetylmuramoyl-L-alanine amidase n=1 Tax=Splendidivirga corallicola TaxID=3051826 RepID=A0ABT8KUX8_9BACT|nr:N-acetylmuramoyl-L-alanine amidase [Fulvivirgaceae bacterium BMA10]
MASKYLWLFDPGHGGIINGEYQTAGKRSPKLEDGRQLFEGEFNRAVVKRIVEDCKSLAIDCINLVDTEIDLPLRERTDLANDIYRRNLQAGGKHCLFISIHANAYMPQGEKLRFNQANGWEIFTTIGETKSDVLAEYFFQEMNKVFPTRRFRSDYSDNDPDKEKNFFVLRKTVMPAVLTENFFMTNREEVDILLSEDGRDKIALGHMNAIKRIENIDLF